MQNALFVGVSSQVALQRELDVIANNMANVSTTGFKARSSKFQVFEMPKAREARFPLGDRRVAFTVDAGSPLDTTGGPVETTGRALDAAIKGDAYFSVRAAGGERYTRDGAFSLDAAGQIVASDGKPVLGTDGPITVGPQETDLAIGLDGTVTTSQGTKGKLKLTRFPDAGTLVNDGANRFTATRPGVPAGTTSQIEPNALERSNVRPVLEMTRLIEVNRAYTNVAGIITRMDEMKRSAIARLADVSNA